ncbi:MAG TPA: hypothetical protein VNR65_10700, partial [Geobacterales bacterium]|nr:hypothetical protein [Geobacterales bacterium]
MNLLDISPDEFVRLSERVVGIAADYLRGIDSRSIVPAEGGAEIEKLYRTELPEQGLAGKA